MTPKDLRQAAATLTGEARGRLLERADVVEDLLARKEGPQLRMRWPRSEMGKLVDHYTTGKHVQKRSPLPVQAQEVTGEPKTPLSDFETLDELAAHVGGSPTGALAVPGGVCDVVGCVLEIDHHGRRCMRGDGTHFGMEF